MPIDPSVLLLGLQPQARTPYDAPDVAAERQARVQKLREEQQQKQQADYEAKVYDWAIKNNLGPDGQPDMPRVAKALYSVNGTFGDKFVKAVTTARKATADTYDLEDKHRTNQVTLLGQSAANTDQTNYGDNFQSWKALGLQPEQFGLGPTWTPDTPARLKAVGDAATSMPEHYKAKQDAINRFVKGDFVHGAAEYVQARGANLTDGDVVDLTKRMTEFGAHPEEVRTVMDQTPQQLQAWAPGVIEGPAKVEELKGAAESRAQTAENQRLTREQAAANAQATATNRQVVGSREDQRLAMERERLGLEHQRLAYNQGQGAAAPIDPNAPHGADFLKTIPQQADMVKALAEGRQPWPSSFALRTPYWADLMKKVFQYDPTFDTAQASNNARVKTRVDFTSGNSAKTINALNTVAGHLSVLADQAAQLGNTESDMINAVRNWATLGGSTRGVTINNFNIAKQAVVDELTRAYRQTGGSEKDIAGWSATINAAKSPSELKGAWRTIGGLLQSKLEAMQTQADQGLGTGSLQVIDPKGRAALTRLTGTGHYVGEHVTLKNGKTITISVVHSDGSFEGQ